MTFKTTSLCWILKRMRCNSLSGTIYNRTMFQRKLWANWLTGSLVVFGGSIWMIRQSFWLLVYWDHFLGIRWYKSRSYKASGLHAYSSVLNMSKSKNWQWRILSCFPMEPFLLMKSQNSKAIFWTFSASSFSSQAFISTLQYFTAKENCLLRNRKKCYFGLKSGCCKDYWAMLMKKLSYSTS